MLQYINASKITKLINLDIIQYFAFGYAEH